MFDIWFIVGLGATVLLLLVGHWFPWPRRLPRLWAYVWGVACLLIGQAIWLQDSYTVLGLCAFALAGGAAVFGAYRLDELVRLIRKAWKAERLMADDDAE